MAAMPTPRPAFAVARCAATVCDDARAALCFALDDGAEPPEWVELIPAANAQGIVRGRDGRWWRMPDVAAVAKAFDIPLPVDVNHASELQAPSGQESPAQGWVEALEARDGALWGRVAWTPRGRQAIGERAYRFLSPVFRFDPKTHVIQRLTSVGLVNEPNFPLALNRATQPENPAVDEAIRKALGLPELATPDQAVTAINALRTAGSQAPALDKYVPRADYDVALNRASAAETQLREQAAAQQQAAIDAEVDAALKAGKITPATMDYHKAQCATEGGLARFREFVKVAATVAAPTQLDGAKPADGTKALNGATATIAAMFGNTAQDIETFGGES